MWSHSRPTVPQYRPELPPDIPTLPPPTSARRCRGKLYPGLDHVEGVTCKPVAYASDPAGGQQGPDGEGVGVGLAGEVAFGGFVA